MPPILPPESPLRLVHRGDPSEAGWGGGALTNKHKQSCGSWGQAEPCARSWRPKFNLGPACPDLPVNAGRETRRAACRTWSRSMRSRKYLFGQTRAESSPSTSLRLFNHSFLLPFLNIHRIPTHGLARCADIHHRGYFCLFFFVSLLAPFQNFNLISLFLCLPHSRGKPLRRCCFTYLRLCPQ